MTRIPPTPPPVMRLEFAHSDTLTGGTYTRSKYEQFPHSVSHAILIGMDDDETATVPDLAARLGISIEQVQACLEATSERLSTLLLTLPPTGPTSVRNRTGNGP